MKGKIVNGKKRYQFDFDEKAAARLEELVNETHAASRAEVVRRALVVLDIVSKAQARGEVLCLKGPDGELRELILV